MLAMPVAGFHRASPSTTLDEKYGIYVAVFSILRKQNWAVNDFFRVNR